MKFRWMTLAMTGMIVFLGAVLVDSARAERRSKLRPVLLIGLDGGEWTVIEDMWSKGYMPNFKSLADRGVRAPLATQYGKSPVIWTTIATGMKPDVHGITGFVVATEDGDVPVASTQRKVPAVWNIASAANLYVNVVGWWGSWPAEKVTGVNITEKVQSKDPNAAHPPEWDRKVKAELAQVNAQTYMQMFPGDQHFAGEDRVVAHYAPQLAAQDFDLMVMYLHGSDPNSHRYWRYYRPQDFATPPDPAELQKHADKVPKAYRSIDLVVGRVLEAAAKDTNIIIVSDHGFKALDRPLVKVTIDMDIVLSKLGYATLTNGKADVKKSRAYNYGSALNEQRKRIRFAVAGRDAGGTVDPSQVEVLRTQLMKDLAAVTYSSGKPVFKVSMPTAAEKANGVDIMVDILDDGAGKELMIKGVVTTEPVKGMIENSGGHSGDPPGVLIAAGPDINPKAVTKGISIHDITPTVLYGMGLPVAQDMAGRAWVELFTPEFRSANPLKTVPTYGRINASGVSSAQDEDKMLEELRELGYIE